MMADFVGRYSYCIIKDFFVSDIYALLLKEYSKYDLGQSANDDSKFSIDKDWIRFSCNLFGYSNIYSRGDTVLAVLLWYLAKSKLKLKLLDFVQEMREKGQKPRKIMFLLRCVDLKKAGLKKSSLAKVLNTSRQNIYRWDKLFKECEKKRRPLEVEYRRKLVNDFNKDHTRAAKLLDELKIEVGGFYEKSPREKPRLKSKNKKPSKRYRIVRGRKRL